MELNRCLKKGERKISQKKSMGWLCSYTPLELIYAAGFQPYRIDGHSKPITNADSYISANYCQVVKSIVDVAIEGGYDFLEGVVILNSCDAMRRLYDVWKAFIPSKFIYLMDLPMGSATTGVKYLRNELGKLKVALEKLSSNSISNSDINDAIDIFSESRSLYRKLDLLRLQDPPIISGEEVMKLSSNFFKSDPKEWNLKVTGLIEGLSNNDPIDKNPRIILSGSPIHDVEFISFIEECDLNVVYEDVCSGSKFFDLIIKKSEDPLIALSEAYLNRTPCARMMKIEDRAQNLINISEKNNLDGIIHHSLKFCDTYLYDVPKLKEILNENGISVLFLESDGTLGSLNQLKTRIEAFSEMISN